MDTNLATVASSLNTRKSAGYRNEDSYYARHGAAWSPLARKPATDQSPGLRTIAATFAVVILYCVLVPYAPALLLS